MGLNTVELDAKDRQILEALQADARQSLSALGKRIGLSQPAMSERVRKLEEAGVITGYGARVDPVALGLRIQAVVRLKTTHEHLRACVALFEKMPEVVEVLRITGEDCFFVRCLIAAPEDLERVVDGLAVYGSVTTSLVLSHPVRKPVPVGPPRR